MSPKKRLLLIFVVLGLVVSTQASSPTLEAAHQVVEIIITDQGFLPDTFTISAGHT